MIRRPARPVAALCLAAALLGGFAACGSDGPSKTAASANPSSPAETLVNAGLRSLQAGDDAIATASFQAALEVDPGNVFANYNLGYIAQTAGKEAKALRYYDAALETDPDFVSALYNKAYLIENDDLDAAIALYRQVVTQMPEYAAAHMRLGFALLHQGATADGEKALSEGIRLDPSMKNVTAPDYRQD